MKKVLLGDIAQIYSGGTPARDNPAFWNGDIPWVKTTQIQNGLIRREDVDECITKEALKKSATKMVPAGTILMAMYGQGKTRGQVAKLMIDATINQACAAILAKENVDTEFLFQQLLSLYDRIRALSNTGGQENLSGGLIKEIKISLPSLPEQKAIAETLSTWDLAIEKLDRLIAAKERWFSGVVSDLIPNSGKKGWNQYRMGQLFKERSENNRGDLPLLSITRNRGVIPHAEAGRIDSSNDDKSKYLRISPGDIGYNTMRMWQGVSALSTLEGIVSPAYTVCMPTEKIDPDFASFLFKTPYMIHQFYSYSQGLTSDTWNLKYNHFKKIPVNVPSVEEQKDIATTLKSLQQEIDNIKQQAAALRRQKRGLMQKLLTGEWLVNDAGEYNER